MLLKKQFYAYGADTLNKICEYFEFSVLTPHSSSASSYVPPSDVNISEVIDGLLNNYDRRVRPNYNRKSDDKAN